MKWICYPLFFFTGSCKWKIIKLYLSKKKFPYKKDECPGNKKKEKKNIKFNFHYFSIWSEHEARKD